MPIVLLIEDVALVRLTLRKFLEKAGHEVVECAGGDEAARVLKTRPFDIVVTDLWMQAGDGLDFIRHVRAGGGTLPILAITGGDPRSPMASSADAARNVGATAILIKPVTKASLTAAVAELLAVQPAPSPAEGNHLGL